MSIPRSAIRDQLALGFDPEPEEERPSKFCFFLGTHHPAWLAYANVPLFLSYHRLAMRSSVPRATSPWALDSGGFTELLQHGSWTLDPRTYARDVRWLAQGVGRLRFAAIQDWMCEPDVRRKTGLTVEEHQRLTVRSWLELTAFAPEISWMPVLQGWTFGDYLEHAEMYDAADSSWRNCVVGLGSVCRRQATARVQSLIKILANEGLRLHVFGFKRQGLKNVAQYIDSSDSLAWSFEARRRPPLPGCSHSSCANCLDYALLWRSEVLAQLEAHH